MISLLLKKNVLTFIWMQMWIANFVQNFKFREMKTEIRYEFLPNDEWVQ